MTPSRLSALVRDELGQFSWAAREYRDPHRLLLRRRVRASLGRPDLPRRPRVAGSVWGVSVVKNEADVIESVVGHLLRQDLAGVIVADNASTDGTFELLTALARREPRLHVVRDGWPRHDQAEKVTALAGFARRAGADWIVPFDGDEFWFAEGATLGEYFAETTRREPDLGALYVRWLNMVPLSATQHVDDATTFLLDATPIFPGKIAVRTHPALVIAQGNHTAARVGRRRVGELWVGHALYRRPEQVARKLRQGAAAERATRHTLAGHWAAGSALTDAEIADAWATITRGGSRPDLAVPAVGPMVEVRPQSWSVWDPDGDVPRDV